MSDTLMTIIGIFVAVILMFLFPMMEMAGKGDELSQTVVQSATSDFVNKVATQGKITKFDYDALVQKLYSTGNSYEIEIEVQILDENPKRLTTTTSKDLTGEQKYYSVYTNTILEKLKEGNNGEYSLKKDDYVIVNVKNTNITIGTQFKNMFYKIIGQDTYTIGTSASASVLNVDEQEVKKEAKINSVEKTYTEKTVTLNRKQQATESSTSEFDVVVILDCEEQCMPYHNSDGTSEEFIENILRAIPRGNDIKFILTSSPGVIRESGTYSQWIHGATANTSSRKLYNGNKNSM